MALRETSLLNADDETEDWTKEDKEVFWEEAINRYMFESRTRSFIHYMMEEEEEATPEAQARTAAAAEKKKQSDAEDAADEDAYGIVTRSTPT